MIHYMKCFWIILLMCVACAPIPMTPLLFAQTAFPSPFADLPKQDRALLRDLILLNYPPLDWRKGENKPDPDPTYDVVIVGAGMAGLTAGAALFKEGIFHIKLFDQNRPGSEGPWTTYARMKTLRSPKEIMGPALGIPHLTFHAWFDAVFGVEAWKKLEKIPTELWMDYLKWYRQAMQLPVENCCTLVDLIPIREGFELAFLQEGKPLIVRARKVVLATGRAGFGGPFIPHFMKHLPQSVYAHTMDSINFEALKGRCVGIIGVGASSFDAAAVALETGAKSVDLLMRRNCLPTVNKFSSLPYKGFNNGYFKLSDEKRWEFMSIALEESTPPPIEALRRVAKYSNFRILSNRTISHIDFDGIQVYVNTNRGRYAYDFLILGTGFDISGYQQPELHRVIDQIALWRDRLPEHIVNQHPKMGCFPYLGPSYEFLPKEPGIAPYLKNLYCYNYGATLSHGLLSSDIPGISIGATRLAQGIAADFFIENSDWYLECLRRYETSDFEQTECLLNFQ